MTAAMPSQLLKAALSCAKRGWPVFPLHHIVQEKCSCNRSECSSPGKHPRTAKGVLDATTDQRQINDWWEERPNANVGVATGKGSGIVVLDLDVKTQGPERWAELLDINGAIDTLTTITGGGAHWIFQAPEESLRSTASQIPKGIDTSAEGGYIVVPPSNHLSGQLYEWDNRQSPTPLPEWLMLLWPKHQVNPQSSNGSSHDGPDPKDYPHWLSEVLANGAPEGERNSVAHRVAAYFRTKGIPRDIILGIMRDFAAKCSPPMELPELQRTIDSAQRYAVQVSEAKISDPPEFQDRLGTLTYTWPDPGIRIMVEQLHKNRQGTQCELTIDSIGGETEKAILGPVGYNLTFTSGRETIIRNLSRRWEINWDEILEKLTRMVSAYLRLGEPVKHLREYMYRPASEWILEHLILQEQPSMIFGSGGLGKSLVALAAILTLEAGSPVLPGLRTEPGHRGIYLDWERTGIYEHGVRYRKLLNGVNLEPAKMDTIYLSCTGSITDNVRKIKRTIDDEGVTFAIIDSAGFACGSEPEKAECALQFFEAVHQLEVPALIIAHQTKGDVRGIPFGSVFWHNAARVTWEIRKQQVPGENRLKVGLFNRKSNIGSLARPLGFSIEFLGESTTISQFEPRTNFELAEGAITVSDQVAALLEEESLTVKDISEATGKTENAIRTVLNRYKDRFVQIEHNEGAPKWGILYRT